jgi:hypothetical protein
MWSIGYREEEEDAEYEMQRGGGPERQGMFLNIQVSERFSNISPTALVVNPPDT